MIGLNDKALGNEPENSVALGKKCKMCEWPPPSSTCLTIIFPISLIFTRISVGNENCFE